MKIISRFMLLCALAVLAGCASPKGGTADTTEYQYHDDWRHDYNSDVPNVRWGD
jgi:hypothetical protein